MIRKVISKYALAAHLGVLAAFPVVFHPFLDAATLGSATLWLSLFAAMWLFAEPSIRMGEHSAAARQRVCAAIVRDPLFYFFLFSVLFSGERWFNAGVARVYDVEQASWIIREPAFSVFPASTGDAGFWPFVASVALGVFTLGVRHGLGRAARTFCGLTACGLVGVGGILYAVLAVLGGHPDFLKSAHATFSDLPFPGVAYGMFLLPALAYGAEGECSRWQLSRLLLVFGVGGAAAGVVFFAPPAVAVVFLATALLYMMFCQTYVSRAGSRGGFVRAMVFTLLGLAVPAFILFALGSDELRAFKLAHLAPDTILPVGYAETRAALARISKEMWLAHPWCGAGLGTFEIHAPFLAQKAEWAFLPSHPSHAVSAYWTLLCERGIIGCAVLAIGLALLLWAWGARLAEAFAYLRRHEDSDVFAFACPPAVWLILPQLLLTVALLFFEPAFRAPPSLFAFVVPLALSAAAFPRNPHLSAVRGKDADENA